MGNGNNSSTSQQEITEGRATLATAITLRTPGQVQKSYFGRGTFGLDAASGNYPLSWPSQEVFVLWKEQEEQTKCIELRVARTKPQKPTSAWKTRVTYVCSREPTGGIKQLQPGHEPKQTNCKIPSQKTGCVCILVVKTYLDTNAIRGQYIDIHSHATGKANIIYTRLSKAVKQQIVDYLTQGLAIGTVLQKICGANFHKSHAGPVPAIHPAPQSQSNFSHSMGGEVRGIRFSSLLQKSCQSEPIGHIHA
ncbi:hypothetical protein BDV98DRAFT_586091 [Pterulicium gracile]|uniref:Uncharacterized protein n=1 Tax=Pterulicium gracile TaxID=1884261 RepID=A0A5C3Q4W5_9AGAR|nr:hypothetical protein BDV98DRAFT_586091 [Pterula gracilis]